jgi:hypothetical protein
MPSKGPSPSPWSLSTERGWEFSASKPQASAGPRTPAQACRRNLLLAPGPRRPTQPAFPRPPRQLMPSKGPSPSPWSLSTERGWESSPSKPQASAGPRTPAQAGAIHYSRQARADQRSLLPETAQADHAVERTVPDPLEPLH